jgi:hypothetical protein
MRQLTWQRSSGPLAFAAVRKLSLPRPPPLTAPIVSKVCESVHRQVTDILKIVELYGRCYPREYGKLRLKGYREHSRVLLHVFHTPQVTLQVCCWFSIWRSKCLLTLKRWEVKRHVRCSSISVCSTCIYVCCKKMSPMACGCFAPTLFSFFLLPRRTSPTSPAPVLQLRAFINITIIKYTAELVKIAWVGSIFPLPWVG